MARNVREIMNSELFTLGSEDSTELALAGILAYGITGAPVVDSEGRPVGMVSVRDLVGADGAVSEHMHSAVPRVHPEATIAEAGRVLAETGHHRLAVIDASGRLVGNVSALDVVRGLLGLPIVHPPAFPHLDQTTGLVWTDEAELEPEMLRVAPADSGLFVLIDGGPYHPDTVVWAESTDNVRRRLEQIVVHPEGEPALLTRMVERARLRFRAAACPEQAVRIGALSRLLESARLGESAPDFSD